MLQITSCDKNEEAVGQLLISELEKHNDISYSEIAKEASMQSKKTVATMVSENGLAQSPV